MALTVRDIMDADPVTVEPGDDVETLVRRLRQHELPGVPVVNTGLFGGVVSLEPLTRDQQ
jgi:CBS domain-containing protein